MEGYTQEFEVLVAQEPQTLEIIAGLFLCRFVNKNPHCN